MVRMDGQSTVSHESANGGSLRDLVASAKAGEEAALSTLIQGQVPSIISHVRARLGGPLRRQVDTDDVAQSVVRELCDDLSNLEYRGRRAFAAWVHLKTRNKLRTLYRRHYRRKELRDRHLTCPSDDRRRPDARLVACEDRGLAHELLGQLPPTARLIVWMRLYEGRPFAEIASELELSGPDSARKRYTRALDQVRQRAAPG